ncbi:hypothetical protein [Leptospirillum ferriphilum]|uniref:hypothetical protein n=1 Tax=Leptospirillum ferriphilum TaxID=178606 RepID=UPI0015C3147E|nr:hypothetical protein [Leptospirillum ferriphilum]
MTPAMVNKVLGYQEKLGIARALTSRKRHRVFSYASTIEILSRGTGGRVKRRS